MKVQLKIFSFSILFLYIVGGGYLYINNLGKMLPVYNNSPINASIELSNSKIEVTKDITDIQDIHTINLITKVKNNTVEDLTNVILVIGADIGTLETPVTKRYTHLRPKENDTVFALDNIHPGGTIQGVVRLYSTNQRIYTFKAWIFTNEQYVVTTNTVILTAE